MCGEPVESGVLENFVSAFENGDTGLADLLAIERLLRLGIERVWNWSGSIDLLRLVIVRDGARAGLHPGGFLQ